MATGAGWSLSLTGDTFPADWTFTIVPNANLGQLVTLLLDGSAGFTIVDRTSRAREHPVRRRGSTSSPRRAGRSTCSTAAPPGIAGAAPVGDLFQSILINFHGDGPRTTFTFVQDTDNDIRATQVPEPGPLALLAVAALGMALACRRS